MSIMSSVYDLSMGMPTSELVYMIFYRCLVFRKFPIRCAPSSRHTHVAYKVYRLSLVPTSYFGGHYVTHYFGHSGYVSTSMYSSYQKDLSHEKSNWFPALQGFFLEGCHRLAVLHNVEMSDFHKIL